jgi:hypothetical protein
MTKEGSRALDRFEQGTGARSQAPGKALTFSCTKNLSTGCATMLWLTSPFFCTKSPPVILSCDPRTPLGSRERQGLGPLDPQQSSLLDPEEVLRFTCMFAQAADATEQSIPRSAKAYKPRLLTEAA